MVVRDDILPEELTEQQTFIVDNIIKEFSAGIPESKQNMHPMGFRMRQPKPAKDVDGFTDLVMQVIQDKQNAEHIAANQRVVFTEDFPPGEVITEVITYRIQKRSPASFSRGKPFNQDVQEFKPHIRGIDVDPENPGYRVVTLGQKFENELILTCWAKTNKAANVRARWLEDLLKEYAWFIRYNGIDEYFFLQQGEDVGLQLQGTKNYLVGRPLHYYVRTERLTHVLEPTIRRIVVQYGLGEYSSE